MTLACSLLLLTLVTELLSLLVDTGVVGSTVAVATLCGSDWVSLNEGGFVWLFL